MSALSDRTSPFSTEEHATWAEIVSRQKATRAAQMVSIFVDGVARLEFDRDTIPSLDEVNARLGRLTGWKGVYVKGLEDGAGFYSLLRDRCFPVGHFVRDRKDLNYTPAPDVVHDLYGHVPFHADQAYADYCQRYGALACQFLADPVRLRRLERYFWFTNEFALVETPKGRRIFGAGIASSVGECAYALSDQPEVLPFDVEAICAQEFRIDQMQPRLFVLKSVEQLYSSFDRLEQTVRA
jgi:phenylalanine-4-hydroxylase